MSDYLSTLKADQLSNIYAVIDEANKMGVTNPHAQAAILDVISKESAFYPQPETSYRNTSNDRIRKIFGSRVPADDASLNKLKQNDEAFFNAVYGGRYGNSPSEGYKFRGRGFNQLTFKGNYASIGQRIGKDLVTNPDVVNNIDVAAAIVIDYFKREFAKKGLDINSFTDSRTALKRVFEANRGFAHGSIDEVPDKTGGYQLALTRIDDFDKIVGEGKKKKITEYAIIVLLSLALYYIVIKLIPALANYKIVVLILMLVGVYFTYQKTSLKNINNLVI